MVFQPDFEVLDVDHILCATGCGFHLPYIA